MYLRWFPVIEFRVRIMVFKEEKPSNGLHIVHQMREKLGLIETQKAAEAERRRAAVDVEKTALIDKLSEPPDKRNGLNVPRPLLSGL
jgi:hypothetical protein